MGGKRQLNAVFREQYSSVKGLNKRGAPAAIFYLNKQSYLFPLEQPSDDLYCRDGSKGPLALNERPCLNTAYDTQDGGKFLNGGEATKPFNWTDYWKTQPVQTFSYVAKVIVVFWTLTLMAACVLYIRWGLLIGGAILLAWWIASSVVPALHLAAPNGRAKDRAKKR